MPTADAIARLLERLCRELGCCLPPADRARLMEDVPASPRACTDAVLEAEGLDAATADRHLYRAVLARVGDVYRDA